MAPHVLSGAALWVLRALVGMAGGRDTAGRMTSGLAKRVDREASGGGLRQMSSTISATRTILLESLDAQGV